MTPPKAPLPHRSKASLVVLILLAFLLLAAAVVLALSIPEQTVLPDATESIDLAAAAQLGFACDATEAQRLYPFAQGVIKLTHNRLAYLAIDGSEVFAQEIDMASPFAVVGSNRVLAADRDGTSFVIVDETGLVASGNREGRIAGATFGPGNYLALIEDRHDSTGVVAIVDSTTGDLTYECHFPESGYVLAVRFTPDGQAFDVALVNADGLVTRPVLKRFALDGEALGQRILDASGLYPSLAYDEDGQLVISSDSRLTGVDYASDQPRFALDLPRIESVTATASGLVVLAGERVSGKLGLYPLTGTGQLGLRTQIGETATAPAVFGSLLALGSSTRVFVYDAQGQTLRLDANLAAEIVRLAFTDSQTLTVVTSTGVRRLTIP
jgi:type II secretory pathway pseudopilin PulG